MKYGLSILYTGGYFTCLLLHAGVLLYRLGGDSRSRLRGVVLLNVSAGSGDGSPCLATTDADGDAKQDQRQQDALA